MVVTIYLSPAYYHKPTKLIQSTDLSAFTAIKVTMEESTSINDDYINLKVVSYPNPTVDKTINFRFNKRVKSPLI